jgi:chromosome segregation ATPase
VKTIAIVLLILVTAVIVCHAVLGQSAATVEQAGAALSATEHQLTDAVTKSAATLGAIDQGLATPQGLSQELQEFDRAAQQLERLVGELDREIAAFDTARTEKMTEFNDEFDAIASAPIRHHLEHLRARANASAARRLAHSRAILTRLQTVVTRGADVQHAARCLHIAHDLDVQGSDLRDQVQFTRQQAAEYARLTTTLLAALTHAAENGD